MGHGMARFLCTACRPLKFKDQEKGLSGVLMRGDGSCLYVMEMSELVVVALAVWGE